MKPKALHSYAFLGMLAVCTQAYVARAESRAPSVHERVMRVEFDPDSRVFVDVSGGVGGANGAFQGVWLASVGASYRVENESGPLGDRIRWTQNHDFAHGYLSPLAKGQTFANITLYRGGFLRHSDAGYLTFPGSPPRRVAFPLDVGFDVRALRLVELPTRDGDDRYVTTVLQSAMVLDPLRIGRGRSLEFGLGARYDIDFALNSNRKAVAVVHRVAPMSELCLRFRWRDRAGLTSMVIEGRWSPHWASDSGWVVAAGEGSASLRRVLFAVNDQPIAWTLHLSGRAIPRAEDRPPHSELRATSGLELSFNLR